MGCFKNDWFQVISTSNSIEEGLAFSFHTHASFLACKLNFITYSVGTHERWCITKGLQANNVKR